MLYLRVNNTYYSWCKSTYTINHRLIAKWQYTVIHSNKPCMAAHICMWICYVNVDQKHRNFLLVKDPFCK